MDFQDLLNKYKGNKDEINLITFLLTLAEHKILTDEEHMYIVNHLRTPIREKLGLPV